MLRSLNDMEGYAIRATNGAIGAVDSFLFDDKLWNIIYVVVDAGTWLTGRLTLISPVTFGTPDWAARWIPTNLTREQVRNAPKLDSDAPVSRQYQVLLNEHYGWGNYWHEYGEVAGSDQDEEPEFHEKGDPSLRDTEAVKGYHLIASGERVGTVYDFLADQDQWSIRYLIIDTGGWLSGRKLIISPWWLEKIDWGSSAAYAKVSAEQIKESPEFDASKPVTREYEIALHDYYGESGYWEA